MPVILAGGQGTRLWPHSRRLMPKQFCDVIGEHSLFQSTVLRAAQVSTSLPIIITNEDYYFLCLDQLKAINIHKAHFILEPCPRNTAPAIGLAAQYLKNIGRASEWMVVMPSDHWMPDDQQFKNMTSLCDDDNLSDSLLTMGIQPTTPETGYGYIEVAGSIAPDVYHVGRFIEKPSLEKATQLIESGSCYWNGGIFMFRASTLLNELAFHAPQVAMAIQTALIENESSDYVRVDHDKFASCPSISIDYAVMEKSQHVIMVVYTGQWSDLGSWAAIADIKQQDEQGNCVSGQVILEDTRDCLVEAGNQVVATLGMERCVIVATDDAVLVAEKSRAQDVKKLVSALKLERHDSVESHRQVMRPWGYYKQLARGEGYQVKHLMIKPGASISLQLHHHRAEHWVVVSGVATVIKAEETIQLHTNESVFIPVETKHRMSNHTQAPVHVIEVQSGDYLGEDDIVRFDDVYGRVKESIVT